jgi:hypothetical protein
MKVSTDCLGLAVRLIISLPFIHLVHSASTVSIVSDSGYVGERTCAQNCVWHVGGSDDLITFLGCSNSEGWQNACYCRSDLQSSASSFLTSCVNKACSTNPADLATAVSVYSTYCIGAVGSPTAPSSQGSAATTTLGGGSPTETVLVVTTVLSTSSASTQNMGFTTLVSPTSATIPSEFFRLAILGLFIVLPALLL